LDLQWGLGIFLSSVVTRATLNVDGDLAWRLPFIVQWVWPLPLFLCAYFVPESPWWLVRKGRNEEAKESLRRLATKETYDETEFTQRAAMMMHTTALEKTETAGASWFDCFRGINLRRTEIVCATWAFQWLCGNPLMGFSVVFYERAGLSEANAFNLNIVMNSTYMIGTVISWFLMDRVGRKTLYTSGGFISCAILAIIGTLGSVTQTTAVAWATGSLFIAFAFLYNCTIGPTCYAIVSEIPSGRLRAKTIVLARLTYNLTGLVTNTITPKMLNPDAWNWGAKGAFLYLGTCFLLSVYFFFRLPETRHRSFGEIELLFESKVPARKFPSTTVDQFAVRDHDSHALRKADSIATSHAESKDIKDESDYITTATLDA
jgi:MFS transporter, SP family, general alpha glucoside:H+ symporter